jgi:hypothetical protein
MLLDCCLPRGEIIDGWFRQVERVVMPLHV